jgi:hypothetical protein
LYEQQETALSKGEVLANLTRGEIHTLEETNSWLKEEKKKF